MTELEWQKITSADDEAVIQFLRRRTTDRKLRLFACACCRRLSWDSSLDPSFHTAIETGERYADGLASIDEFNLAGEAVCDRITSERREDLRIWAATLLVFDNYSGTMWARRDAMWEGHVLPGNRESETRPAWLAAAVWVAARLEDRKAEHAAQADLLRDIFGPLAFRSVPIEQSWLVWNNGTIRQLAQTIYDDRAFDRLPILGDALEEAGCTDADILNHCRQPGEHVRGCWVVDLLSEKR